MMHAGWALLFWLALPFWETKAPQDWTDAEIQELLHNSPWAQMAGPRPEVQVYLATAEPLREAEAELARRRHPEVTNDDYLDWLRQEGAHSLVLAVAYHNWSALADERESHRMEEESIMKVGRRKYKIVGHFPPAPADPFLRLVFPRAVTEGDKVVTFELYLPRNGPFHAAQFLVREMRYKGRLEM